MNAFFILSSVALSVLGELESCPQIQNFCSPTAHGLPCFPSCEKGTLLGAAADGTILCNNGSWSGKPLCEISKAKDSESEDKTSLAFLGYTIPLALLLLLLLLLCCWRFCCFKSDDEDEDLEKSKVVVVKPLGVSAHNTLDKEGKESVISSEPAQNWSVPIGPNVMQIDRSIRSPFVDVSMDQMQEVEHGASSVVSASRRIPEAPQTRVVKRSVSPVMPNAMYLERKPTEDGQVAMDVVKRSVSPVVGSVHNTQSGPSGVAGLTAGAGVPVTTDVRELDVAEETTAVYVRRSDRVRDMQANNASLPTTFSPQLNRVEKAEEGVEV